MNRFLTGGALSLIALTVGCGPSLPTTVPVTGTVTYKDKPVEGATVNFLGEKSSVAASGKTDAEGKFTLKTMFGEKLVEGATIGKHNVAIIKTSSTDAGEMGDPKEMMAQMTTNPAITSDYKPKHLLPEKFGSPSTSGLEAEVTEGGPNNFTFDLE